MRDAKFEAQQRQQRAAQLAFGLRKLAAEREREDLIARLTAPYIFADPIVVTPQKRFRMLADVRDGLKERV